MSTAPPIGSVHLRQFACPYIAHDETSCPFGHVDDCRTPLRPLPTNICLYHLLGQCSASVSTADDLPRCLDGFHPTEENLVHWDAFQKKVPWLTGVSSDSQSTAENRHRSLRRSPGHWKRKNRRTTRQRSNSDRSPAETGRLGETSVLCYLTICMASIVIIFCFSLPILIFWFFGWVLIYQY